MRTPHYGLLSYRYASKWGDELQQLEAARRALAFGTGGPYLKFQLFRSILVACFKLELQTRQYAEAMKTWKHIQDSDIDTTELRPAIARLETLRSNDEAYEIPGEISERGWHLHLFKRHFRIEVAEGHVTQVKLRCDKRYQFFAFDPKVRYEVSDKDGSCSIELDGEPGSSFKFIQS